MNQTTTALLDTLTICRDALPKDTHPIWLIRLQVLERLVKHAVEREPQFWTDTLARGERVVDQVQAQRRRGTS
jgi:hypothetical protein